MSRYRQRSYSKGAKRENPERIVKGSALLMSGDPEKMREEQELFVKRAQLRRRERERQAEETQDILRRLRGE